MRFLVLIASVALVGCGSSADENEEFVDALLDKHLVAPEGYPGEGIPAEMAEYLRDCARPSLLEAARDLSDTDKADILASVQSLDGEYSMPSQEQVEKAFRVNSIIAGCGAAAFGMLKR